MRFFAVKCEKASTAYLKLGLFRQDPFEDFVPPEAKQPDLLDILPALKAERKKLHKDQKRNKRDRRKRKRPVDNRRSRDFKKRKYRYGTGKKFMVAI